MSTLPDRRTRKRLATRQAISDVATRLFIERGFDNVTVDEIAEAADVGRKTVFNHFARKEDMFFDLNDQGQDDLKQAVRTREADTSLIETLRLFAHQAALEDRAYVRFLPGSERFVAAVMASGALMARARAIRDEITQVLASELADAARQPPDDPAANLAASLFVTTWVVAAMEAHKVFRNSDNADEAKMVFLSVIDRGTRGVTVAMEGTPYG
jgi:AcrR family transcriptional regulator